VIKLNLNLFSNIVLVKFFKHSEPPAKRERKKSVRKV